MDADTAAWMTDNMKAVITKEYVTALLKENAAGVMLYLSGEADTLPTFDLQPKYVELRAVTMESLSLERVLAMVNLSAEGVNNDILKLMGILDENGEINVVLKEQAMRATFDNNDVLKDLFMIQTVEDALKIAEVENPTATIEKARKWISFFHKAIMPTLLLLSFLTVLLLLMNLSRPRIGFRYNGFAYTLGSSIAMIVGFMLSQSNGYAYRWLDSKLGSVANRLSAWVNFEQIVQPMGNKIISGALIFLGIGVAFMVLTAIFAGKRASRRARRDDVGDY